MNKVEKKKFLGMEVRVVNGEYMVLKDMFSALGRLTTDGKIHNDDRKKVKEFAGLGIISEERSLTITLKGKKQSREVQEVKCILLSDVPMLLTQFKPTIKRGEQALNTWVDFMKFVNGLLTTLEVHKYIVTDKKEQLKQQDELTELGGIAQRMNNMVCEIMADLIGVDGKVKKDELRSYQDQTTIDLLDVYSFVRDNFVKAYMFSNSHKSAKEMVYNAAMKKYPFKMKQSA